MIVAVAGPRAGSPPEHLEELEAILRVLLDPYLGEPRLIHGASPDRRCLDWQAVEILRRIPHPVAVESYPPRPRGRGDFGRAAHARMVEMARDAHVLIACESPGPGTRGTVAKFDRVRKPVIEVPRGWTLRQ